MTHQHEHTHGSNKRVLKISFFIITVYMIIEVIGGLVTNSLALLSDAGHMLSDSLSLGVGLLAFTFSERMANYSKTYGYKRFEILAAVFNGVLLIGIAIYIFYEASKRFFEPTEIASTGMLVIGIIGLLVNVVVAWLFNHGDTEGNLNVRAAFLHVLGDLLGSIGAIMAALLIMFFGWGWADPLASVLVAILVLVSGWRVTREGLHVLMEGVPENVDMDQVIEAIETVDGVYGIHDLHVWSITSGQNALSMHAVVDGELSINEAQKLLQTLERILEQYQINHVTIQLENTDHLHDTSILCEWNEDQSIMPDEEGERN